MTEKKICQLYYFGSLNNNNCIHISYLCKNEMCSWLKPFKFLEEKKRRLYK